MLSIWSNAYPTPSVCHNRDTDLNGRRKTSVVKYCGCTQESCLYNARLRKSCFALSHFTERKSPLITEVLITLGTPETTFDFKLTGITNVSAMMITITQKRRGRKNKSGNVLPTDLTKHEGQAFGGVVSYITNQSKDDSVR